MFSMIFRNSQERIRIVGFFPPQCNLEDIKVVVMNEVVEVFPKLRSIERRLVSFVDKLNSLDNFNVKEIHVYEANSKWN